MKANSFIWCESNLFFKNQNFYQIFLVIINGTMENRYFDYLYSILFKGITTLTRDLNGILEIIKRKSMEHSGIWVDITSKESKILW